MGSSSEEQKVVKVAELAELACLIEELPPQYQAQLSAALRHCEACLDRRRRIVNYIQDALSQLRLDMKFTLFDLEATRKERDEYRRQLEEIR